MMEWTDRHYRYMMRGLTRHTQLYTEMIVDSTLLHRREDLDIFLGHDECEHPLAVQLGGSDPVQVGEAAALCEAYGGFNEINLNVHPKTCSPSSKPSSPPSPPPPPHPHRARPQKPVSPASPPPKNRSVPPLDYSRVHSLVGIFPEVKVVINGGIGSWEEALSHLEEEGSLAAGWGPPVAGVMMGRAAYHCPWMFRKADTSFEQVVPHFAPNSPPAASIAGADVSQITMVGADAGGGGKRGETGPGGARWANAVGKRSAVTPPLFGKWMATTCVANDGLSRSILRHF
ncbi:hypothetical protein NSK_007459 [Nannochloropsis salina CCMP1776]|uniref:DUS-like FMN-binding domain-containing protein n=1 Tax=Nannochloropsis salina CCMP1776 TaxID=1027361 RepID=A0A4D9CUP7_9STRA|nr:hypothetical protein NSK_007459 [Nannochloropsis salina CCMP1776]|eukprot:TFJ81213.1 hypothetical protein NSK_007459 [Nannochloropsis salina CCMP1776]